MSKRINKNSLLIVLGIFQLMGCIPEPLEVNDIPKADAKVVVSSVFVPDRRVALVLTKNFGALSGDIQDSNNTALIEEILIDRAEVKISVAGESIQLEQLQTGLYVTQNLPQFFDQPYVLEINDVFNGNKASAETYMIEPVNFESVNVTTFISAGDTFPTVSYEFLDPPGKNWYMINVQYFEATEDVLESFLDTRVFTHLVTDQDRNGQLITDDFTAFVGREVEIGDSIAVSLSSISEPYYNFLDKWNNRFFAIDLVSEPFNLPTNVSNGYGFFNLHVPDNRILRVQ